MLVYLSTLGRFLQTDPIGYGDGLNWYAYVHNDPLNKGDPTGTCGGDFEVPGTCTQIKGEGESSSRDARVAFVAPPAAATTAATGTEAGGAAAGGFSFTAIVATALGTIANTVLFPGHTASNDCMGPGGSCGGPVLYHYTTQTGQAAIIASQSILPSTKAQNPRDANYGDGQYFTDIAPGTKNKWELARALVGNPVQGARFTNYVAVDMTGLRVIAGREHVYIVPNSGPLIIAGRLVGAGGN